MLYPLTFQPIFKERLWGGRELERLFGKNLPQGGAIGESWEISDRPGDQSIIGNGRFAGKSLRWLMENFSSELAGETKMAPAGRFPLLCKILDARDKLSLQVHPAPGIAGAISDPKREPKSEMWFIAHAAPGAELFVGLKRGVSQSEFKTKLMEGSVADCFHRLSVRAGDAIFLPSGRVHGIGAGLVIFEIQQNSDTTYRVFDWNRGGLDGRPRELHVAEALANVNFDDFEPQLIGGGYRPDGMALKRPLVNDALFCAEHWKLGPDAPAPLAPQRLQIVAVTSGTSQIRGGSESVILQAGQFALVPACLAQTEILTKSAAELLRVEV
ncbi:MAG: class I mannose-6-phosphate isomerase [Verrucomicrobia bacterium]|nr:class I mannose-6-phosphate isomerase [Verrucomicrobiota bacterium]MDE3098526.1 class I mannose-6-phosphate isomerase [Verrucomicrobiota bacterium]